MSAKNSAIIATLIVGLLALFFWTTLFAPYVAAAVGIALAVAMVWGVFFGLCHTMHVSQAHTAPWESDAQSGQSWRQDLDEPC